jgi:tRNA (guanine37-N1)-methyltransferase
MTGQTGLYSGFDVIGNIAIIKPRSKLSATDARMIATDVMRKNKHITSVFKKVGRTEGEERVPKVVWVAGKKSSATLHKENGCVFYIDIKKVFFTPRLSSERLRISKSTKRNESVLDMFCGVGPYAIELAKTAKEIYAIDINHSAIEELKRNIYLNKVGNVHVFEGDSKKISWKLKKKFDRIIMNFPVGTYDFLPAAIKAAKKECIIHMYSFIDEKEGYDNSVSSSIKKIREIIDGAATVRRITAKRAGEVAPYMVRECFDIYVEK